MSSVLIESVACSVDDAVEAEGGGADRLELCSAMVLGGLTPSLGTLIEARAATRLPIVSMIRPRAGGFCYTAGEFAAMLRDVELAATHGAQGIVFGVLDADGRIDVPRCRALIERARAAGRAAGAVAGPATGHDTRDNTGPDIGPAAEVSGPCEAIFHRAFDVLVDPHEGLETLVDLGVTRVLTSGRQATALAGAPLIRALAERAAGRIALLAGGGIREGNVADVIRTTGVSQVHLGPFTHRLDPSGRSNPSLTFSSHQVPPEGQYPLVDREGLRRVREAARLT